MKITNLRRIFSSILIFNFLSAGALAQPGISGRRIIIIQTPSRSVLIRSEIPRLESKSPAIEIFRVGSRPPVNPFTEMLKARDNQNQVNTKLFALLDSCEFPPVLQTRFKSLSAPAPVSLSQRIITIPRRR